MDRAAPTRCEADTPNGICNTRLKRDWTCPASHKHVEKCQCIYDDCPGGEIAKATHLVALDAVGPTIPMCKHCADHWRRRHPSVTSVEA